MNLKDNGVNVIVGQRQSSSYQEAIKDGWIPGINLVSLEEAVELGTIIIYLLSDKGQVQYWPKIKDSLRKGKLLCFAHGFALAYQKHTNIIPPQDIDVSLIAPKGDGNTMRELFNETKGLKGLNASYSIYSDYTKKAKKRTISIARATGIMNLFETTFEEETYIDLVAERGSLLGGLAGIMEAQYEVLRNNGHSPSESFNATVEELTEGLIKLVSKKGMEWLFANCSSTAQRGALDWKKKFKNTLKPLFENLYNSVKSGKEAIRIIEVSDTKNYKQELKKELNTISDHEMWRAGKEIRKLR